MNTQSPWHALFITVLGLTAVACITINVYFPEAAVRDLSEKIEDAVAREAAKIDDNPSTDEDGESESEGSSASEPDGFEMASLSARLYGTVVGSLLDLTAADVQAQSGVAAPEITNPAIRKIVQSRASRVQQLDRFKSMGVLGESNRALVEVRSLDPLELRQRAAVQKLVREENADRDRMFREIAAATSADLAQLPQIQSTYAETLRRNARAGEWIQMPDGQWKQKD